MMAQAFDKAFREVQKLASVFRANHSFFVSAAFSEAQARKDFIDKFLILLGWDVNHDEQRNPFEQEVKVERLVTMRSGQRHADYAFHVAPNFRDARLIIEAKKPYGEIATADNYFQTVRYGWNKQNPLAGLTNFEQFHLLDCRYTPDIDSAINRCAEKWTLDDYFDRDKFARLYWLIAREAVIHGSLERFADGLPKPRRSAKHRKLFVGANLSIDDSFLQKLDEHRMTLASAFKSRNHALDSETLTEATQRTLDRLVFMRFLEDKLIEPSHFVAHFGENGTAWQDFVVASRRLDRSYNGIVFKKHAILDATDFRLDDQAFADICADLSHEHSPYDFNAIPIHILGSIYERFLGNVIVATDKRVRIEPKPEVRKAGGVYYTPVHIVRYIVENTVGRLIHGKTPAEIAKMRFLDIACGSGSFLLGIYELLLNYHAAFYNANPRKVRKGECIEKDGVLHLSVEKKREILLNNIYGVDIDPQAVEVTQLSLYLKLLEEETIASAHNYQLKIHAAILPSLNKNVMCGNSLVGTDFHRQRQIDGVESDDRLRINAFDFDREFRDIMEQGRFDAVIGNPPYIDSEWMTKYLSETRKYCVGRYAAASGNWDIFCVFAERAIKLCKDGGYSSFIVPNKLGAAGYAAAIRRVLTVDNQLISVRDYSHVPVFPVSVYPIVYAVCRATPDTAKGEVLYEKMRLAGDGAIEFERTERLSYGKYFTTPEAPWEIFNSGGGESLRAKLSGFPKLESGADVLGAATVAEAYEIQELIREARANENGAVKLVNSGTIDRYNNLWGRKPCRYLGDKILSPVVPRNKLKELPRKRLEQAQTPKVIIAGMTKRLEAIADLSGTVLAGKSTTIVVSSHDPRLILAILNSKLINHFYNKVFGGNKLAGGYLRIGPPQVRQIPFPSAATLTTKRVQRIIDAVQQLIELFEPFYLATVEHQKVAIVRQIEATDQQIDQLVYELYGLNDEDIEVVEDSTRGNEPVTSTDAEEELDD